jgi:hypothetical protein
MKVDSSSIESEKFVIDTVYHVWIFNIRTGIKAQNCEIELLEGADDIAVASVEDHINLRPKKSPFILERRELPFFSSVELTVSFVTRPRIDGVISYVKEETEVANGRQCTKTITVQNKQNYPLERIHLARTLDFEPPSFEVEELTSQGAVQVLTAQVETSKDMMGRTTKAALTWEVSFQPSQQKVFRASYTLSREEEGIASAMTRLVIQSSLLFKQITGVENIFKDSMLIADILHTPCTFEKDFAHKIGILCQLFDVPLDPLRHLLGEVVNKDWQSLKLLEEWLKVSDPNCDPTIIKTWRNIVEIRNKSPPFHRPDNKIIELCEFFDQKYPPDYLDLWVCITNRFKKTLQDFVEVLQRIKEKS